MEYVDLLFGSIELEVCGKAYDLHNFYDFRELIYSVEKRSVTMLWSKSQGAPEEELMEIVVEFLEVSHFSTETRDPSIPFSEDNCLASIAYVQEQDSIDNAYYVDNPTSDLHCVFEFHSGLKVRIFGSKVRCKLYA